MRARSLLPLLLGFATAGPALAEWNKPPTSLTTQALHGVGASLAHLGGGAAPELILVSHSLSSSGDGEYVIGIAPDFTGSNDSVTATQIVDGDFSQVAGIGVAAGYINAGGQTDLVLVSYDGDPTGPSDWSYTVLFDVNVDGTSASSTAPILVSGVGWVADGGDVALGQLDADPRPDLILMAYDTPSGRPAEYRWRVGYNLSSNGAAQHWTDWVHVVGGGFRAAGAGVAIADLGRDAAADMLLVGVDIDPFSGQRVVHYKAGFDLDAEGRPARWLPDVEVHRFPASMDIDGAAITLGQFTGGPELDALIVVGEQDGFLVYHTFIAEDVGATLGELPVPQAPTLLKTVVEDLYRDRVWPEAVKVLNDRIVHSALAMSGGLASDASVDLVKPPSFQLMSDDSLQIRFPETNVDTWVYSNGNWVLSEWDDWYNVDITFWGSTYTPLQLVVDANVRPNDATRQLHVEGWDLVLSEFDAARVDGHLTFLDTMRWDVETSSFDAQPEIVRDAPLWEADSTVDILLVADGFDAASLASFRSFAQRFADTLDTGGDGIAPFSSYAHAIRVGVLPIVVGDATPGSTERFITVYDDPGEGSVKAGFANLARLGELFSRGTTDDFDVVVFVSNTVAEAEAKGLVGSARAFAVGNLVMFPFNPYVWQTSPPHLDEGYYDGRVDTLFHELGHTILGGLADEYDGRGGETTTCYLGDRPPFPNVDSRSAPRAVRWKDLLGEPSASGTVGVYQGAYSFDQCIYRPTPSCKMRDSAADPIEPFCVVCQRALTQGLLSVVDHQHAQIAVEYLGPNRRGEASLHVHEGSAFGNIWAVNGAPENVRLSLTYSPLPRPWHVEWERRTSNGVLAWSRDGESVEADVLPGDKITLRISTTLPSAGGELPVVEHELHVHGEDLPVHATPEPPVDLAQTVPLGGVVSSAYGEDDGRVVMSPVVKLSLTSACIPGWTVPCATDFELQRWEPAEVTSQRIYSAPPGTPLARTYPYLAEGKYEWRARSVFHDATSDWVSISPDTPHFIVDGARYWSEAKPPHDPVDLHHVLSWRDEEVRLSAVSWDLNGDDVQLEFEVVPFEDPFTGTPTAVSAILPAPAEGSPSLRVIGDVSVPVSLDGTVYKWRVRAVAGEHQSAWVSGGEFPDHRDVVALRIVNIDISDIVPRDYELIAANQPLTPPSDCLDCMIDGFLITPSDDLERIDELELLAFGLLLELSMGELLEQVPSGVVFVAGEEIPLSMFEHWAAYDGIVFQLRPNAQAQAEPELPTMVPVAGVGRVPRHASGGLWGQ